MNGIVTTSARPAPEPDSFAPDVSLTKDIPIPAENLAAQEEVPAVAEAAVAQDFSAEVNAQPEAPAVLSREEKLRTYRCHVLRWKRSISLERFEKAAVGGLGNWAHTRKLTEVWTV